MNMPSLGFKGYKIVCSVSSTCPIADRIIGTTEYSLFMFMSYKILCTIFSMPSAADRSIGTIEDSFFHV
jgi:hypothetical protein